jgi:N-terminal 7TM region of histidine kinase
MVWQSNPYIQLSTVTFAIAVNLVAYAWSRRRSAIGKTFIVLMAAVAEWSLAMILQLCSSDFVLQSFWYKFWYPGVVTVPVAWFVFAMIYTGRGKFVTRRNMVLLGTIPAITLFAVATDSSFHLMWQEINLDARGSYPLIVTDPNIWFWVHTAFSYSLMVVSTFWLLQILLDSSSAYRKQAGVILLGALVPWIINLIRTYAFENFK